jgi:hypothetical protein
MKNFDMPTFCRNLAAQLPPGWSYTEQYGESGRLLPYQKIIHKDGGSLSLILQADRVEISPNWINDHGTSYPKEYGPEKAERPSKITVSTARVITSLAKDINQRLVVPYLPAFAQGVKEWSEWNDYLAAKQKVVDQLCGVLKRDASEHQGNESILASVYAIGTPESDRNHHNAVNVHVRVNTPNSIRLELGGLDLDTVLKILAMFPKRPIDKRKP